MTFTSTRHYRLGAIALAIVTLASLALGPAAPARAATQQIIDSTGWDIFNGASSGGFRYGPSIIINPDNSIDMWTSAPGSNGQWDNIYWRHSTDGGHTWTGDYAAQAPTPGSRDAFSTCDPGVIKIGSYYYLGYTSTEDSRGTNNQLYISRSTRPDGGFEKWNGSGWGGNPQPFISYTDDPNSFGIGEPSFVEKDGTLFIYYTYINGTTNQTRVATASASNGNWPGAVTQQGVAVNREPGGVATGSGSSLNEDSMDVKYVDSIGKFIAVSVGKRLNTDSYTISYESTNGITFTPSVFANNDKQNFAHNIGISGTPNGHLDTTKANFVSFAYGPNWGAWNTHISPISLGAQSVGVSYRTHMQNLGWGAYVTENRISGAEASGLRMEAFQLSLTNPSAGMTVQYQAHVQSIGWQPWVAGGGLAGTSGQSLRIESVKFQLQGSVPAGYHIKYRVYQNGGWSPWRLDGQAAGITGQNLRVEALQVFVYRQ
ncbi:hypothetical protein [Microbacterium aurum]